MGQMAEAQELRGNKQGTEVRAKCLETELNDMYKQTLRRGRAGRSGADPALTAASHGLSNRSLALHHLNLTSHLEISSPHECGALWKVAARAYFP